ncbi:MAG TPA: hypothetical protein VI998_01170 [Patescibacteria group bacterium]|nr:hypothetical protein [Patescibacteria group bacterium]
MQQNIIHEINKIETDAEKFVQDARIKEEQTTKDLEAKLRESTALRISQAQEEARKVIESEEERMDKEMTQFEQSSKKEAELEKNKLLSRKDDIKKYLISRFMEFIKSY